MTTEGSIHMAFLWEPGKLPYTFEEALKYLEAYPWPPEVLSELLYESGGLHTYDGGEDGSLGPCFTVEVLEAKEATTPHDYHKARRVVLTFPVLAFGTGKAFELYGEFHTSNGFQDDTATWNLVQAVPVKRVDWVRVPRPGSGKAAQPPAKKAR